MEGISLNAVPWRFIWKSRTPVSWTGRSTTCRTARSSWTIVRKSLAAGAQELNSGAAACLFPQAAARHTGRGVMPATVAPELLQGLLRESWASTGLSSPTRHTWWASQEKCGAASSCPLPCRAAAIQFYTISPPPNDGRSCRGGLRPPDARTAGWTAAARSFFRSAVLAARIATHRFPGRWCWRGCLASSLDLRFAPAPPPPLFLPPVHTSKEQFPPAPPSPPAPHPFFPFFRFPRVFLFCGFAAKGARPASDSLIFPLLPRMRERW